jgi:hypothetical protein
MRVGSIAACRVRVRFARPPSLPDLPYPSNKPPLGKRGPWQIVMHPIGTERRWSVVGFRRVAAVAPRDIPPLPSSNPESFHSRALPFQQLGSRGEKCLPVGRHQRSRAAEDGESLRLVKPKVAYAIHAINASMSTGLTCNGAAPTAIASATRPSILPVDLRFEGLRLPASSSVMTVFATHIESTGWFPWAI